MLPAESSEHEVPYIYNDLASVEAGIAALDGDCAAIFVGGCSYPYSGQTEEPTPEFAQGLRKLADEAGAFLVGPAVCAPNALPMGAVAAPSRLTLRR